MDKKLSWDEIAQQYDGEWIELIDFEWDDSEPDPRCGIVRVHSKNRKEFQVLAKKDAPEKSAVFYVGDPFKLEPNMIFNANQHQWLKKSENV